MRPPYAEGGRPPVASAVFFKPQLVMPFEGLRSEQELMRVAADRPSVEWYLGHDLHGPLPDRSNLTRTRELFGIAALRRSFEEVVEPCAGVGLARCKELFFDSAKVEADADMWTASPPGISWRTTSAGSWRVNRPTPERRSPKHRPRDVRLLCLLVLFLEVRIISSIYKARNKEASNTVNYYSG